MKCKWPKPLFFFGGDFGFLDFTIFRFHLSGDFSTSRGRWGSKAGSRQITALLCGNSGRGIQNVMFGKGESPKERCHFSTTGETYATE